MIRERVLSSLFGHDLIGQDNLQDISHGILYSTILVQLYFTSIMYYIIDSSTCL